MKSWIRPWITKIFNHVQFWSLYKGITSAKVNHTNELADSLHTKTNILDNQIKTIDQNKGKISEKLDKIQQVIENDESNILVHKSIKNGKCDENNKTGFNLIEDQFTHKIVGGKPKPISTQQLTTSNITLDSDKAVDHVHKDVNNDEIIDIHDTIKCDTLILSDSILQRIVPKRFSPKEKNIKRYIRGGAETCASFIQKSGNKYSPLRVLIHIGSRDIQKDGVNCAQFIKIIFTSSKYLAKFSHICVTSTEAERYGLFSHNQCKL